MPHIFVENLVKTFRIAERKPGMWGALQGVVHRRYRTVSALDGISLHPAGRTRRLHRPQRRGQVHHRQGPFRHPRTRFGPL